MNWPPNYTKIYERREKQLIEVRNDPSLLVGAKAFYKDHPVDFIEDWCVTHDPRNAGVKTKLAYMPFVLFPKQKEYIDFLQACIRDQTGGLVEKSRDVGATWVSCAYAIWLWLYTEGVTIGFGSKKASWLDRLGDPSSIFEKFRLILRNLPIEYLPYKFDMDKHTSLLKILNVENGSTIAGEAGDDIGRGGRSLIYFKDESAHYERPERIEAALSDNTNVQIDISSVSGSGTFFERRREAGRVWEPEQKPDHKHVKVFIFDWRDHPAKDEAWYKWRRDKAEAEGSLHIFAQEIDRDYTAAQEGIVISSAWVKSAIDADKKLGFEPSGQKLAALDVADTGGDQNAVCIRHGNCILDLRAWGGGDTVKTTQKTIKLMEPYGVRILLYDSLGVGAGVRAETNRLQRERKIKNYEITAWIASRAPIFKARRVNMGDSRSPKNSDFYKNLKAQAWWELRKRFEKTYQTVTRQIEHPAEELISIPSGLKNLHELVKQLSQVTYSLDPGGKIIIDKKAGGSKSPNMADACVMAFWPVKKTSFRWSTSG